jgi:hypothetical protein
MADYRQIHTCIWKDSWFLELPSDFKLLFIYLFSNERACLLGLYDLSIKVIAFETDLPIDTIEAGLACFARDRKAYYEDGMIWVPTLLKHNAQNITSPKIQAHIKAAIASTRDCPIKARWIEYYNLQIPYPYRIDTHSEIKKEQEQEQEQEKEQPTLTGANAPPPVPRSFPEWETYLASVKNHPALVQRMCKELYPDKELPNFGIIGKIAKEMGKGVDGYRRLMGLLWEYSARPPQGDLLPYLLRVHQGQEKDNGRTAERKVSTSPVITSIS